MDIYNNISVSHYFQTRPTYNNKNQLLNLKAFVCKKKVMRVTEKYQQQNCKNNAKSFFMNEN